MESENKNNGQAVGIFLAVIITLLVVSVVFLLFGGFNLSSIQNNDNSSNTIKDTETTEEVETDEDVAEVNEADENVDEVEDANVPDSNEDVAEVDVDFLREQFKSRDDFDLFLGDIDLHVNEADEIVDEEGAPADLSFVMDNFNDSDFADLSSKLNSQAQSNLNSYLQMRKNNNVDASGAMDISRAAAGVSNFNWGVVFEN